MKQGIAKKYRPLFGAAALLLAGAALLALSFPKPAEARKTWFAMDTYITMTAWGKQPNAALEEAADRIRELESLLSVTDEKSDLYAVNHSGGVLAAGPFLRDASHHRGGRSFSPRGSLKSFLLTATTPI